MEQRILDAINKAMDDSMKEFMDEPNSIFFNKKDQLIYKYSIIKELKNWKRNQSCIVKGCKNRSIERSHTIQKSGSIKQISENGHILTPNLNPDTGQMEITKIGINEASTFPGYCNEHENLFHGFEQIKEFENGEHFGLQLYRTVCREIVIKENHIKELEFITTKYKEYRNTKVKESFISKLDQEIINIPTLEFKDFTIDSNDYKLRSAIKHTKESLRYLNEFLYKFQDAILNDLKKRKFTKIAYVAIVFDREIPVALAGRGNFLMKLKTKTHDVEVIFNVLPLKKKTYIFISSLKKNEKELKHYMEHFINPLQLVSMIENWMVHGSDHWFIRPSVWEAINPNAQSEILNEILNDSYNISNELKLTIFKDLKSVSIKLMDDNIDQLTEPLIQLLNKEKSKISLS
jgi:hypothetical protein